MQTKPDTRAVNKEIVRRPIGGIVTDSSATDVHSRLVGARREIEATAEFAKA
jgi:hypothetical protein